MKHAEEIKRKYNKLTMQYNLLIEKAYNLRQTDHEASDIFEYSALKKLNKINKIKYLTRERPKLVI